MAMRLVLTVAQRLELCQYLDIAGGATESIFPEVEAVLQASTDHQQALDCVARRKNADKYRSVIDFLLCELHPQLQAGCFRFYLGGGPPLRELITEPQRQLLAWDMLQALVIAHDAFTEDRRLSWAGLKSAVDKAA